MCSFQIPSFRAGEGQAKRSRKLLDWVVGAKEGWAKKKKKKSRQFNKQISQ